MKIKTIPFHAKKEGPRYLQLYETLRMEILQGHMKKGDQLPSIRSCAKQLALSKTTIENAYQRLLLEGYISAHPQRGYFVDADDRQVLLRKEIMESDQPQIPDKRVIDLRSSSIDAHGFDSSIWLHYLKEVLKEDEGILAYGDPQGERILRKALQKYVYAFRGVLSKEDQVIIGASFQSLLYLICSLYQGEKRVGMEIGGFIQAEQVFHDCGFQVVYLDHDEEGVRLEEQVGNLGMLYINSASCGTKKRSLRTQRRNEIFTYTKAHHTLILEDDHNGELRYQTKIRPAMQGFDMDEQVIYMRSFSKLLLPSIRMSFMVLPETLSARYQQRKNNYNPSASKIEQLAFARYLMDGHMEKQIRTMRRRYEEKSTVMMKAVDEFFPQTAYILDESGLQLLLEFSQDCALEELVRRARAFDILIQIHPLRRIALSFAAISVEEIPRLIKQLSFIWKDFI